ncbi:uncharacterized protein LOC142177142 [Nicotiana tabacum]|uniref:Uncharacterized protein LOC142177142 n=1 Tax=Nicotiana tabacum TaxID=4097 RepID=A0AC58TWT1_TOBAC
MKGVMRLGKKTKLSPRYIGPFEVLERVNEVAYRLALLPRLSGVHRVFYAFMLWKYDDEQLHVFDFKSVKLDENFAFEEESVAILGSQVQKLGSKDIASVKV